MSLFNGIYGPTYVFVLRLCLGYQVLRGTVDFELLGHYPYIVYSQLQESYNGNRRVKRA